MPFNVGRAGLEPRDRDDAGTNEFAKPGRAPSLELG